MTARPPDLNRWFIGFALLAALILAAILFAGCTKREEAEAKKTGGEVARLVGLPPLVGEGLVAAALAAASYFGGKRHGHSAERKKAKPS